MRKRKKIIHVDQHAIKRNNRRENPEEFEPPISIKTYKENIKTHRARCVGDVLFTYSPRKPLKCGARLWAETTAPVLYVGPEGQILEV